MSRAPGAGMLIIISGPSGSGKGTVVGRLVGEAGSPFSVSVSVTTRPPRAGEEEGKSYFFRSEEQFFDMLRSGELLESATFCGNYYGTPRSYVDWALARGRDIVLEIDVNGALQVSEKYPDCVLIFLVPPTMEELRLRLVGRGSDSQESVADRLRRAREEIRLIGRYDYLVVNGVVDDAVEDIKTIVRAEALRPSRGRGITFNWEGAEC